MIGQPQSFEAAMADLAFSIGGIERHPPITSHDLHRLRCLVERLDNTTTRSARVIEEIAA